MRRTPLAVKVIVRVEVEVVLSALEVIMTLIMPLSLVAIRVIRRKSSSSTYSRYMRSRITG